MLPHISPKRLGRRHFVGAALLLVAAVADQAGAASLVEVEETHYPGQYSIVWGYADGDAVTGRLAAVRVQGKQFVIEPQTIPPSINSMFLLEHSQVNSGETVLDMGTGTGLHAVFSADSASKVVATDIDAAAIDNAKHNAQLNGVADKIDFRVGDLFAALKPDEKFDVIYLNVAYPFDDKTLNRWQLHERFFTDVRQHMKTNARIYYQIGFLNNIPYASNMINRNGLRIMRLVMASAPFYEREPIFMQLQAFTEPQSGQSPAR